MENSRTLGNLVKPSGTKLYELGFFVIGRMALPPVPPKRLKVKAALKGTLARH